MHRSDKSSASQAESRQQELMEKTCQALGMIGSTDAVPTLREIIDRKGLLSKSRYRLQLKTAAEKALNAIYGAQLDR